jgi:predicted HTH transcriptional regulator
MKAWEKRALELLEKSIRPVPQELNELDWKLDLSPNKIRLSEHISALANLPGGGFLVLGIRNTPVPKLEGLSPLDVSKTVGQIANLSRDALDPVVKTDHAVILFDGFPLLFISIHESAVKPVHLKKGGLENCFVRSGGTTRKAGRQEIGALMLNSKNPNFEELHASTLLSGQEVLNSLDCRGISDLLGRPLSGTADEILFWMKQEKMIKEVGDGYYITNFGVLAAARNIHDFDGLSRKAVRLIQYDGSDKTYTRKEHPGRMGYAIGFEGLIDFINAMLPHSEVIKKALRTETSVYPEIAIRELVANALIHQDFSMSGTGPMIEVFDDRIEITSPGRLLPCKKLDRLIGSNPESRNEILAAAFRRYNICEERGSGLEKAVRAIEIFGLPPLRFEEGENYFRVTMFSPRKYKDMSPDERIQACYQHAVIQHLANKGITNTSLRERLKMSERQRPQVSVLIKTAVEKGFVKPKNPENASSKFAEYIPYWA